MGAARPADPNQLLTAELTQGILFGRYRVGTGAAPAVTEPKIVSPEEIAPTHRAGQHDRERRPRSDLDIMDLSAILQSLATNRRAGRLVVRRPDGREKHLYLVKGRVRLITATDIDADREALSCALLRSSIMTLDEIESSMAAAAESKAPLNQFLTEHLATLGSSAGKALDNSTHQEVLDLFSWRSMHCEFFTYESDSPQAILCAGLPGACSSPAPASGPALRTAILMRL